MNKHRTVYLIPALVCVFAGCADNAKFEPLRRICSKNMSKDEVMRAAQEVLGDMYFAVEKADLEQGYIRTEPLAGAQFFELWRHDNVGSYNTVESNLHTLQKIAELHLTEESSGVCITCDVKTQRLSLPERQMNSTTRAYNLFSKSSPGLQKLKIDPKQQKGMAWIDLGSDPKLETKILRQIEKRIGISGEKK